MKEILQNMATLELLRYCKDNNIDPSGTYTYKYPRRFTYVLLRDSDGKAIVTVTLSKHSVPLFYIHK